MLGLRSFLFVFFCLSLPSTVFAAFDSAGLPTNGDLTILRITPDGEDVPAGHQITIEFNRPVVALGKMDRSSSEIPVTITPALTCQWRWITVRTLACELDDKAAMQPSTSYTLTMQPGIKTLDGVTISEPKEHTFITRRATLTDIEFRAWKTPTLPVMRVVWDQSVTKASVLAHLYMLDANHDRVPVIVSLDQEKRILPGWLHLPGEKKDLLTNEAEQSSEDDVRQVNGEEARRIWLIEPAHELLPNQTVELHVEPGFVSALGPMPSAEDGNRKTFDTFPEFRFIGVRCTNNAHNEVHITPGETQKPEDLCNPLAPVGLEFTTPVMRREVKNNVAFEPSLQTHEPGADPWGDLSQDREQVRFAYRKDHAYSVFLPHGLKAAQNYTLDLPGRKPNWFDKLKTEIMVLLGRPTPETDVVRDQFGRWLPEAITMSFATDHRAPNILLEYHAAVLEKNIESEVPIYVNNINRIDLSYNQLTLAGPSKDLSHSLKLPHIEDLQFLTPLGVREMLGNQSGALWAGLTTDPDLRGMPLQEIGRTSFTQRHHPARNAFTDDEPQFFAEITPFQVHLKLGHFNSLVWVTDLTTGLPVPDADVILYKDALNDMNGPQKDDLTVHTDKDGLAVLPGTEEIDPELLANAYRQDSDERFFVRVSKGNDMALLPVWVQFQIDNYRSTGTSFYPQNKKKFGPMVTWGTTAEGIYHPGDTIQYKLYVRNQDNKELTAPPVKGYWLEVVDPTGKVVYQVKDITLSDFGSASGEFVVGKKASVGWYNFRLKANFSTPAPNDGNAACAQAPAGKEADDEETSENSDNASAQCASQAEFTWIPLKVLVSDFTPVPFQVRNQLNDDLFHAGDKVSVETDAKLHSGGPYTQAAARVTAILTESPFVSHNPLAEGFVFGTEVEATEPQQVFQATDALDDKGEYKTAFTIEEKKIYHGRLMIESAVQDDRGKYVAHQSYADYVGVDRFIGLRLPQWFYKSNDDIAPDYVVVDEHGTPVKDVKVSMFLERKERAAADVKGAGNSYAPETETKIVKESECHGVSDGTAQKVSSHSPPCRRLYVARCRH